MGIRRGFSALVGGDPLLPVLIRWTQEALKGAQGLSAGVSNPVSGSQGPTSSTFPIGSAGAGAEWPSLSVHCECVGPRKMSRGPNFYVGFYGIL